MDGLKKACADLGLEPVQIKNTKAYENMIEYVNKAHANSKNDYGIAFAYKYE